MFPLYRQFDDICGYLSLLATNFSGVRALIPDGLAQMNEFNLHVSLKG